VAKLGGWVVKLIAHLLVTQARRVRIFSKVIMGDISLGLVNTLYQPKNILQRKYNSNRKARKYQGLKMCRIWKNL
jgi:hypothetical protein